MIAELRTVLSVLVISLAAGPSVSAQESDELWLEGRLLVATERLDDPDFERSVVYLIRHRADGAFGLIVNRRIASGPLARLLESLGRDVPTRAEREIAIYDGGPVSREVALLLHDDDYRSEGTIDAGKGLALTPADAALDDLARGSGPTAGLLIVGHAGWAPGQLEQEIAQGAWAVVEAGPAFVLDPEVQDKWRRALARQGQEL